MNAERADYVISSFWPMLEAAILYTLPLAVISFFCGLLIAVIVAVIRTLPHPSAPIKLLQALCRIYISIIRGTPMLVQIFIIFYGFLELGWYAYQMKLIGTGNTPQPKRSAWAELFRLLKNIRQHRLRSERA